jgi:hypothetical protein
MHNRHVRSPRHGARYGQTVDGLRFLPLTATPRAPARTWGAYARPSCGDQTRSDVYTGCATNHEVLRPAEVQLCSTSRQRLISFQDESSHAALEVNVRRNPGQWRVVSPAAPGAC